MRWKCGHASGVPAGNWPTLILRALTSDAVMLRMMRFGRIFMQISQAEWKEECSGQFRRNDGETADKSI